MIQIQIKSPYFNEPEDAHAGSSIVGGDAFGYTTPTGAEQIIIYKVDDARAKEFLIGLVKRLGIYRNVKGFNWTVTVAAPSNESARWLGLIPE